MVFGCALPIIMLAAFEVYFVLTGKTSNRYAEYAAWEQANNAKRNALTAQAQAEAKSENTYSKRIIGLGIFFIGLAIALLGLLSEGHTMLVTGTGACFMLIGVALTWSIKRNNEKKNLQ